MVILHTGLEELQNVLSAGLKEHDPVFKDFSFFKGDLSNIDLFIIGPAAPTPIKLLQSIHSQDKNITPVVIVESGKVTAFRKDLMFAPFVGNNVRLIENKALSSLIHEIEDAFEKTKQKRNFLKFTTGAASLKPTIESSEPLRKEYTSQFFDHAPLGALLLDQDAKILSYNNYAKTLFKVISEDNIDTNHPLSEAIEDALQSYISKTGGSISESNFKRTNGKNLSLEFRFSMPFLLEERTYYILSIINTTERKEWEDRLQHSEASLRLALDTAEIGTWDMDTQNRSLFWSERCLIILGLNPNTIPSYSTFLSLIHPEDKGEVDKKVSHLLEHQNTDTFEEEFRIFTADTKEMKWVRAKGKISNINNAPRFIGALLDITDQINAREILEKNLLQKDEFIGIASHELKTPLTSIKAYVQLLERNISGDDENARYVKRTGEQIEKLNILVSELLDISKIQTGKLQFNMAEINSKDILDECLQSTRHIYPTHNIIVDKADIAKIRGDRFRLEQVLNNFLSNAIKYSPGSKEIHLSVEKKAKEKQVVFSVKDFGIGIPSEKIPFIFQRFYRVDEYSNRFQGLGIGLYIASEIVKRHSGKTWVESQFGKGSTFYFSVPMLSD